MTIRVGDWVKDKRSGVRGMVLGIYGIQYKVSWFCDNNTSSAPVINYSYEDEIITDEAWNTLYGQT